MSYIVIRSALEKQLNTVAPMLDTAFENVRYTPKQSTPWQRVNLLPAMTDNPTMGDQFKREMGVFQVSLFYPVNEGPAPAYTRAEAIRSAFPRGLGFTQGNVRVLVASHPYVGPAIDSDGWYMLPVSVPYIADVQG